ncbi:hypothetical protein K438DRAFT_1754001 [Mycena galopus ATCC 62051]|nr:hypothetical protein K438DRAFT_1754001 [Mycena galopus ATCC 62051]
MLSKCAGPEFWKSKGAFKEGRLPPSQVAVRVITVYALLLSLTPQLRLYSILVPTAKPLGLISSQNPACWTVGPTSSASTSAYVLPSTKMHSNPEEFCFIRAVGNSMGRGKCTGWGWPDGWLLVIRRGPIFRLHPVALAVEADGVDIHSCPGTYERFAPCVPGYEVFPGRLNWREHRAGVPADMRRPLPEVDEVQLPDIEKFGSGERRAGRLTNAQNFSYLIYSHETLPGHRQ